MRNSTALFLGLYVITAATLVGCFGRSPPTTFYTLSATEPPPEKALTSASADAMIIGIGPVDLPGYLDRSHIISRETSHRLDVQEFHQWAEPLNSNFVRVLAENIARRLPEKRVIQYPWGVTPADLQVVVLVTRFDAGAPSGAQRQVHLNALWGIFEEETRQAPLLTQKSHIKLPVAGNDNEALAAVMSRAIGELSRDIANELASQRLKMKVESLLSPDANP